MRLADVLPNLASSIASALEGAGFVHLRQRVLSAAIERWTYDHQALMGYIYLEQLVPMSPGETCAAQTLVFGEPYWFNVDLRLGGDVFGIELLENAKEITGELNTCRAP